MEQEKTKKSKKKKYFYIALIVFVIILVIFISRGKNKEEYKFVLAENGDLIQEVDVVGRVEPVESVDLSFEKSGRIVEVLVGINDRVESGQILVSLDSHDLDAQLNQAQASLESARASLKQYQAALENEEANLSELEKGAKLEEIQLAETMVSNAQKTLNDTFVNLENIKEKAESDLENLYDDVGDILNDGYFKLDDAINKQIDDLFVNDTSLNPLLSFSTANSQAKINSEIGRVKMGANLATFKAEVETISSLSYDNLDQALISGEKNLSSARDFLNLITEAINSAVNVSATDLSVYKTNINLARTNLNTAISNINSQKQLISSQKITNQNNIVTAQNKINEAENSLKVYQDQLALKKSGATVEQIIAQESKVKQARLNIEVQESKVKQAEAEIDNIYAQLAKNILKSPIKGIVTAQNAKVGEIISLNSLVVSVISQDKFELKANVPEADIAKIKKTNQIQVTLDAYDNETIFKAEIFSIDPAEKIIEGVATYKITAKFIEQDERIKSGMTADMNIITAEKKDILIIPSRTIYEKDSKNTVKVLIQQKKKEIVEEREIKTGLKGSEGKIEVLGGLQVGDKIIMP